MNPTRRQVVLQLAALLWLVGIVPLATVAQDDFVAKPEERQLPKRMHSAMKQRPIVTVRNAAIPKGSITRKAA